MDDREKTRKQLLAELSEMRSRVVRLEHALGGLERSEPSPPESETATDQVSAQSPDVVSAAAKPRTRAKTDHSLRSKIGGPNKAEGHLAAELKKFQALYDLAVALTGERSLDENLSLVVEQSRRLLAADTAYIALHDEEADDVYMHTLSGIKTDAFKTLRIPFGGGLGGKVAKTGRGYIVKDYFREIGPLLHGTVRAEGLISGIAVPVQIGRKNLGVLYVFNRRKTSFSESDLDTLSLLGNLAAVEITRKRAQEGLRKAQEHLERQVEERTAQLRQTNAQLVSEIGERNKVEDALRESRQMLDNILSASPLGIAYFEQRKLRWANQAMSEIFGYKSENEYMGKNPREFYASPEDYRRVREIFLKSLAQGKSTETEAQFSRADGSSFYGQLRISVLDPSNPLSGTICALSDISDRKRAEEALRQSEEKYRTIIEEIEDLYYEVDLRGNFTFLNDAAEKTFGYKKEELIGRSYRVIMNKEAADATLELFRKVFKKGVTVRAHEARLLAKDGIGRHVEVSIAPMRQPRGPIIGFRGICRDVTERKRAARELLKLEKLESLGVLAGGIAHDFNNILTAVLGNISLARISLGPDATACRPLIEAERGGIRARDLIQQLLTFSKGGSPIRKTASIAQLVRDSCEFALRGSNVRCEFSFPGDMPSAELDEVQISQVIGNLVINADYAMSQGGVIEVRAENLTMTSDLALPLKDGEYVRISVADHGVGIPAEILPNVFDPYFTTKSEGSGLGLAAAYSIIKNHDGLITVESEVGVGTTFHIYLPASKKEAKPTPSPEDLVVVGEGRILVMDDEEPIRELTTDILSMLGYEVTAVSDGAEAVEMYRLYKDSHRPFDVVVLDLTVPGGLGGREAMRKLVALDPDVRAIVSSGYSNDPIMADYRRYGFRGVIPKPYSAQQLSEVLAGVITRRDA